MSANNPILNSPYVEPLLHYNTDREGALDYNDICKGRRIFKADSAVIHPDKLDKRNFLNGTKMPKNISLTSSTFAEKKLDFGELPIIQTRQE